MAITHSPSMAPTASSITAGCCGNDKHKPEQINITCILLRTETGNRNISCKWAAPANSKHVAPKFSWRWKKHEEWLSINSGGHKPLQMHFKPEGTHAAVAQCFRNCKTL